MKNLVTVLLIIVFLITSVATIFFIFGEKSKTPEVVPEEVISQKQNEYWFKLHRKSKKEFFYKGVPGEINESELIKVFNVNVGISGERPTPLPTLVGKEYWNIIAKFDTNTDPETAPYFLTLDIPWTDVYPYGPEPYTECNGQCDWVRPGSFGLHGIAANPEKLTDAGSSGCIRHTDEEITYLYTLLNPSPENPIRYYIEDV